MATAESYDEIPLADSYADNDIQVPDTYKKAVSRVIEEQLKAYYEGTRTPEVKAFHKWYDNARCFNKIVNNNFNRVINDCLKGQSEARSDYKLTEEGLYHDFKNHLAELTEKCNEDDDEEVSVDSEEDNSDIPAPDIYTEAVDSIIEELSTAYFDGERTTLVVAFQNWYWDGHLQKISADFLKHIVNDCLGGKYGGRKVCQLSREELCNVFKEYITDLAEKGYKGDDDKSPDTEKAMEGFKEEIKVVESEEDDNLFVPDTYRRAVDRVIEELSQAVVDGNKSNVVLAFQKWCEEDIFHKIAMDNFKCIMSECETQSGKYGMRSVYQLYEEELYDSFREYVIDLAEEKNDEDEIYLMVEEEKDLFDVPAAYKRVVNRVIKEMLQAYSGGERTPVVTIVNKWITDGESLNKIATYYFRRVVIDSFSGGFKGKSVYELTDADLYPGFKNYITRLAEKCHEDNSINIDKEGSNIPVPDMYKRAVDKVIEEMLQAYTNGEHTPVVTAVYEWSSDRQEIENIKNDNYKRVINEYLTGRRPPSEEELYNSFKEFMTVLAVGMHDVDGKSSNRLEEIEIRVPDTYRKAASRVADIFLYAYRKGNRTRAVRAFNKWHEDYKKFDKIMTDTYKYIVSEIQAGSTEEKSVLQVPEKILCHKIIKRVTQLSVGFTDADGRSEDSDDDIPIPDNYKNAVTKATEEYLQSYFDGDRSVKVKAFYQWYSDSDIMDDIVNNCFKQMIKRCLDGPIGGETAYEMSENDLYLEFKDYINELVENMDEEDIRSLNRFGDKVLSNKFSRVITKLSGREEILLPETFKRAVARATTDMLHAYADGERARMVTAFHKWYRNDQMFEDIISDSFRSCVESCLEDPIGGKTVYDMSERELYDRFKAFVFELADESYENRGSECSLFESGDEEEIHDEKEEEDYKIEKKEKGFSFKRILSCLFPWAKCFKSRKNLKSKVPPTRSQRFNMIFSRVTARNM